MMSKTISIIGGGIGGLATAILLAKDGHKVSVYEKNECRGGRAGIFEANGFRFDMGPSRYLMPDLFEEYFQMIGEDIHQRLDLKQLSPSYKVFRVDDINPPPQAVTLPCQGENINSQDGIGKSIFSPGQGGCHEVTGGFQSLNVYADQEKMVEIFESIEAGSGQKLRSFLQKSGEQYHIGIEFAKKNYDSIFDFFKWSIAWKGLQLNIRTTIDKYVARFFKTPIIQKIMQYTTVFLGTAPSHTPALYNIMSHVDFAMGVWYPQGGLHEIAEVLVNIGKKHGVEYHLNHDLVSVEIENKKIVKANFSSLIREVAKSESFVTISSDYYIINADQARFETTMLTPDHQTYPKNFRDKKTFAPSGFIIYAGVGKKLANLEHHNLYFNDDWNKSFADIFDRKLMPEDPSLYICAPSKTDPSVAPVDKENLFILVPIPNGIEISPEQKSRYRDKVRAIVEQMAGEEIVPYLEYERIFVVDDFKTRYNARHGTALGLGHLMSQTACFRPNNYSKKLDNLFYVGHNTNPGIGVPMVIVSAMLVFERMQQQGKI